MHQVSQLILLAGFATSCVLAGQGELAVAADPPAQKSKDYELRVIRVGDSYQAIRFKANTGESWFIDDEKFVKIPETGDVPAGDFDIKLITDDKDYIALRIDRTSGATWLLRNRKWSKIAEPKEIKDKEKHAEK